MWIWLIAVPLIIFGMFFYGTTLFCLIGIVGWIFDLKEFQGIKEGEVPKGLTASILLSMILGTVCMILAHHVWTTF
jgi:hypothetical protein